MGQVSPRGILAAVAAAIVAAVGTVGLLVAVLDNPRATQAPAQSSAPRVSDAPPRPSGSLASPPRTLSSRPSLAELAAQGDLDTMMQLQAKRPAERTADESLALARGRSIRKHAAFDELAARLRADLPLSADRENLGKLRSYLEDRESTTEVLAVLASLRVTMAADMIYDIWEHAQPGSEGREIAGDLLVSREVRSTASAALAIALDAQQVGTCEDAWRVLPRSLDVADRRAVPHLERLRIRTGCGPRKLDDCFRCLRAGDDLDKAIRAATARAAPGI